MQELRDKRTGKLDAKLIADYLGVPLLLIAGALCKDKATAHKSPHADSLQKPLAKVEKIISILLEFVEKKELVLAWLESPHRDLDDTSPIKYILDGRADTILSMLMNAVEGVPS